MDFIEVSAKTVDDAITKACIELGISSDRLDIQVITEGSSGFLGFGSKPAVIKVRKKEEPVEKEPEAVITESAAPAEEPVKEAPKAQEKPEKKEKIKAPRKEGGKKESSRKESGRREAPRKEAPKEAPAKAVSPAKEEAPVEKTEEEIVTMKASASRFLDGVFKAMELPVDITMEYHKETGSLDIDFAGEDMGILIGKRGQTLDSLQYLTSLVVNKDQKDYVRVKLDTEDYRKRRKETLENLAKNIAYKVRRTRKPVSLEPMNPYERRIIHSALQNNKYVETYSEGNEPYRHVCGCPEKIISNNSSTLTGSLLHVCFQADSGLPVFSEIPQKNRRAIWQSFRKIPLRQWLRPWLHRESELSGSAVRMRLPLQTEYIEEKKRKS